MADGLMAHHPLFTDSAGDIPHPLVCLVEEVHAKQLVLISVIENLKLLDLNNYFITV